MPKYAELYDDTDTEVKSAWGGLRRSFMRCAAEMKLAAGQSSGGPPGFGLFQYNPVVEIRSALPQTVLVSLSQSDIRGTGTNVWPLILLYLQEEGKAPAKIIALSQRTEAVELKLRPRKPVKLITTAWKPGYEGMAFVSVTSQKALSLERESMAAPPAKGSAEAKITRLFLRRQAQLKRASMSGKQYTGRTVWRITKLKHVYMRAAQYRAKTETTIRRRTLNEAATQTKRKRPDERVADDKAWTAYRREGEGWKPPIEKPERNHPETKNRKRRKRRQKRTTTTETTPTSTPILLAITWTHFDVPKSKRKRGKRNRGPGTEPKKPGRC